MMAYKIGDKVKINTNFFNSGYYINIGDEGEIIGINRWNDTGEIYTYTVSTKKSSNIWYIRPEFFSKIQPFIIQKEEDYYTWLAKR